MISQVGHMRTNKACPKFVGDETTGSLNVALTAEDEELMEKRLEEENLLSSGNSLCMTSQQRMRNSWRRGWKRKTFSLQVTASV
jgi:hypothetical protein